MRINCLVILAILLAPEVYPQEGSQWWRSRARQMVDKQIEARGIRDKELLDAMRTTPRHEFIPQSLRSYAYEDHPLPIGEGQTISQPYIVGLMSDLLDLTGDEKVLEIGTGSGYQAAILARLTDSVFSIEVVESLAIRAENTLKRLGYDNVFVRHGDGYLGWPEHAPFDRVIVTAAPPAIPEKLIEQMKIGGLMVVPVGKHYQELMLIEKTRTGYKKRDILPVRFVPMIHPDEKQ